MQGSFFTNSFHFAYIKLSFIYKVVNICFSEEIRIVVYGLFYCFVAVEVLTKAENAIVTTVKNAIVVTMAKRTTANVSNQNGADTTVDTTFTRQYKV